ncbi:MAG: hypothetical protein M0P59_07960 [Gallionella sp.]|jgi:hypothetical protein|nr:hypothetical protein [Gallionella sp.]MCK9354080.1 hypothetical protein [Gallionella sp.]
MDNEDHAQGTIERAVISHISKLGGTIRNKAALGALVKIIPTVGEALHHALTAGDDALKDEKIQLQLDLLCCLVEKIDASITEMLEKSESLGAGFVEINGQITVRGDNVANVTGLEIGLGRSASINPGTVINVEATNAKSVTGVKI